ncbi:hypothetical protein [Novosphingobium sp. PY1]|uniref:Uncharacterized protein n=1 Tax=Ochrobactrum sp. PW1 TaxID=1882222 RepID=A0A292GNF3_9HYPH|nr:hypothetical protein [Novosphingobium sp. PY1]BBA74398.1 hypothetical protein [Ochrobactrum sp. PW1]GFM29247.1 uncharacterized protein PY1_contig-07-173 [Novosphingobium sp. PY1]
MASAADIPGLTPAEPDLPRLETIITLCEQRVERAAVRLQRATAEHDDAATALESARAARDHWIANNDDPQLMML